MSQHEQHTPSKPLDLTDRRALALQYAPYVRHIAARVKRRVAREIEFDDLVEYGMIGLFEAADRYAPDQGANFMTFAYYRVRGAIYDGLRGMGWLNRGEYAKVRFEERANAYLEDPSHADGHPPGPAPSPGSGSSSSQDAKGATSDDATAGRGPPNSLEHAATKLAAAVRGLATIYITNLDAATTDQLHDEEQLSQEERLGISERRDAVRRILKKLPAEERSIMEMYYYGDMSLEMIGEKLGLSKSWTSRLHARIVHKMHRMLDESVQI